MNQNEINDLLWNWYEHGVNMPHLLFRNANERFYRFKNDNIFIATWIYCRMISVLRYDSEHRQFQSEIAIKLKNNKFIWDSVYV